jgi:hypothetical protein
MWYREWVFARRARLSVPILSCGLLIVRGALFLPPRLRLRG